VHRVLPLDLVNESEVFGLAGRNGMLVVGFTRLVVLQTRRPVDAGATWPTWQPCRATG
jgi:hypothetical protein